MSAWKSRIIRRARRGWKKLALLPSICASEISSRRVDILVPISATETNLKQWGDWHYARAMKKALGTLGYKAQVVFGEFWKTRSNAKYVILLRGLAEYDPPRRDGVRYILWNISHPDMLTAEECRHYDCVLFASRRLADVWRDRLPGIVVRTLLQAADVETMCADSCLSGSPDILFLGNSRGVFRKSLKDILPTTLKLEVIGTGWEAFPDVASHVVAKGVSYSEAARRYRGARIVLNDHWDDMRDQGVVSNRCFDVLAAGGFVISDDLPEIKEIFGDTIVTYVDAFDLRKKIEYYLSHEEERKALAARGHELVVSRHGFEARMRELVGIFAEIEEQFLVPYSFKKVRSEEAGISERKDVVVLAKKHVAFVARLMEEHLKGMGIKVSLCIDSEPQVLDKNIDYIVICPQQYTVLPERYYAYQMEQTISPRHLTRSYLALLDGAKGMLEYSRKNEAFWLEAGFPRDRLYYLPLEIHPQMRMRPSTYDYDVVFYGSVTSPRRNGIIKQLQRRFAVKILHGVFGDELYNELSKAKVVINVHYYENALLETTRLYEVLSLGCSVVVSERSSDPEADAALEGIVDFVPVGDVEAMTSRLEYWLSNETLRRERVDRGYAECLARRGDFHLGLSRALGNHLRN